MRLRKGMLAQAPQPEVSGVYRLLHHTEYLQRATRMPCFMALDLNRANTKGPTQAIEHARWEVGLLLSLHCRTRDFEDGLQHNLSAPIEVP